MNPVIGANVETHITAAATETSPHARIALVWTCFEELRNRADVVSVVRSSQQQPKQAPKIHIDHSAPTKAAMMPVDTRIDTSNTLISILSYQRTDCTFYRVPSVAVSDALNKYCQRSVRDRVPSNRLTMRGAVIATTSAR